ncbi:chorismate mutase [Bacillus tianshenii]|nr:chorismate mutase [Bacillus tianshenii]
MVRGIRGAITVEKNDAEEIVEAAGRLLSKMIERNEIEAESVAQILISVTDDLNAAFPAKALRSLEGWMYVPVMCMQEIPVPNGLPHCIRVMMTVNTSVPQERIEHVYLEDAVKLRPDLTLTNEQQRS